MAALTLNGITMPLSADSWREQRSGGEIARSISGRPLVDARIRKASYSGTLIASDAATRAALCGLVDGRGHKWSCAVDTYSDAKGLGPTDLDAGSVASGRLVLVDESITWMTEPSDQWTIAGAYEESYDAIVRFALTDAGWWSAGIEPQPEGMLDFDPGSGAATITSDWASPGRRYDDLLILPYRLPDAWARSSAIMAAYRAPPYLTMSGDLVAGSTVTVLGRVDSVVARNRGALEPIFEISITLEEY